MKRYWYITAIVFAAALAMVLLLSGRWKPNDSTSEDKLRIVSLAPNVTEILFALDLADCIVGVTNCCDWPAEAKSIECVGGFGAPNIEKLLALHPDLVIAAGFERGDTAEMISKSGIEVLDLWIYSFKELFEAVRKIGKATGKLQEAEEMIVSIQAELKVVSERFERIEPSQRPKVFVEMWYNPLTTAGRKSFIDEIITWAGGVNVARNINQHYPHVNPEKVIEWNPDVIVLCYMEQEGPTAARLADRIGWAEISAVKQGRIIDNIPPDLILRPGPRLLEGVKILAKYLYGAVVEKCDAGSEKLELAGEVR